MDIVVSIFIVVIIVIYNSFEKYCIFERKKCVITLLLCVKKKYKIWQIIRQSHFKISHFKIDMFS